MNFWQEIITLTCPIRGGGHLSQFWSKKRVNCLSKKERILKINDVTIIINDEDPTRVFKIAKKYQFNIVITFLQINRHSKLPDFCFFGGKHQSL